MTIRSTATVIRFSVDAPAELTLIDDTPLADGMESWCTQAGASHGAWSLDKTSADPINGTTIVATLSGLGRWTAGTGGAGSGGATFTNRFDLSVNNARVEDAQSTEPVLYTGTGVNAAGGYVGGGTGNKSILGFKGYDNLPLAAIQSFSYRWENISMEAPGITAYPYINLIVSLDGVVFKVFAITPGRSPVLNIGALTAPSPGVLQFDHVATGDTNFVQVVNGVLPVFPGGVPAPAATIPPNTVWQDQSFRWTDIIAAWPLAKLVEIVAVDGGLPKATKTPAVLAVIGDSANLSLRYLRLLSATMNGVDL